MCDLKSGLAGYRNVKSDIRPVVLVSNRNAYHGFLYISMLCRQLRKGIAVSSCQYICGVFGACAVGAVHVAKYVRGGNEHHMVVKRDKRRGE